MATNIEKLLESMRGQQDLMNKMKGLDLSSQIARSFANRMPENNLANALTGGMRGMMAGLEFTPPFQRELLAQRVAWEGIAGSLNHLVAAKSISENLAQTALLGQLGLHSSLMSLAGQYQERFHNPFSVMDAAIRGITDRAFRQFEFAPTQEEVEEVTEVVEGLGAITAEHAELDRPVTVRDLEKFRTELLDDLVLKLSRSKTAHAIEFILALMHLIGFALHVHAAYVEHTDITNREALEQTKVYVDSLVQGILNDQGSTHEFRWNTRVANHNVNLRRSRSTRSEILDMIEKGEVVLVIAVKKRWLYVSYIDSETGEPCSGYVFKKYFDRE